MIIPDTNGENFVFHPCYSYPMTYHNHEYDCIADAIVGELMPERYLTTSDCWERWSLVENGDIDISSSAAAAVIDELFDAKFLTNEDDYLARKLIWYTDIITEIQDLPKVMWSSMQKTHKKLFDEFNRTLESIYVH